MKFIAALGPKDSSRSCGSVELTMLNRAISTAAVDIRQNVYALKHIESGEFICLLQDGIDYLACFTSGDNALQFREDLGLQEHVNLHAAPINNCPFTHFWLDGKNVVIGES